MDNLVVRVLGALCTRMGTPVSMRVLAHVEAGEWAELLKLRVRPQDYDDAFAYWKDAMCVEFLRKVDIDVGVDREAAAVATFLECELQNKATNDRLSRFASETLLIEDTLDETVYQFIADWRKDIQQTVGHLPDTLTPRFSGGATYADTGLLITTPDKMSSTPTITTGARCLLPLWGDTAWSRALVRGRPWKSDPLTVRGNIFFTVPKDAEKFRGCCKEPSINVGYQLDVGRLLKQRLLRIGIDLKAGQEVHQRLARDSSILGHLATIDMSNASDTVCRLLPKLTLPGEWWQLLDSLRSTHTRVNGRWHKLEKFSSMGNGFTFELESLLFATLARTVIRKEGGDPDLVKCYGDDLIVPVHYAKSVLSALRFFGFTPNKKKTFVEGPFRESCGGDFFDGVPVRAHYLERLPDEPQHWISLANGLRRVALADRSNPTRWDCVRTAWLRCLDAIPSNIRRCRGPEHLGDIVIHDEPEFWSWADLPICRDLLGGDRKIVDTSTWMQKTHIRAYLPVPRVLPWHHWLPTVQLASCTLGLPSTGVTPRGAVTGYRIGVVDAVLRSSWLPTP